MVLIMLKSEYENQLVKRGAVEDQVALSRSTIYAKMQEGTFPKPLKIGSRAVAWLQSDIDNWIEERIAESRPDSN